MRCLCGGCCARLGNERVGLKIRRRSLLCGCCLCCRCRCRSLLLLRLRRLFPPASCFVAPNVFI
ncbi:unnamed protein product [Meloidogyne enterolobii]|uniref:Uncharacterized protein n=1 Tax=Meloidogyne enterolobii TaxID=390850 RepID=A0ACB0YFV4_MELEN